MRRLVVFLILFLVVLYLRTHAQQQLVTYLPIETGMHRAAVFRIDVDVAQRFLVSASSDKTARIWELSTGKLLKILRPPIGDFGKLYAVAISPDGTTVAVGGFSVPQGSIYLFNPDGGAIGRVITGLPDITGHLAYSNDGRYLAAALGGKNGIRVYETRSYTEVARDSEYGDSSYWVEFDKSGKLVTASYDGYVRLYSPDFRLMRKEQPIGGKYPFSSRFSPDGNLIAVGFSDSAAVAVLSPSDLAFRYRPATPSGSLDLDEVAWSADGRTLCAGGKYNRDGVFPVLCWDDAGKGTMKSLPVSGEILLDVRTLNDGGIAFAVSDGTVGVLGADGNTRWRAVPKQLDYRGGAPFPRLSPDGNNVEVEGNHLNGAESTRHVVRFSVRDRKLEIDPNPEPALSGPATVGLDIERWKDSSLPTINGRALLLESYEVSRSLAIAPSRDSFVLGSDWDIYRFDRHGWPLWKIPIPDGAWHVNITPDQRFVVAALGDGTVRWYTFNTGREVLALFVDSDLRRWVAWDPDGFFDFGSGGDSLIEYPISRGADRARDFIKVDQLRQVFYRPDLIGQILTPDGREAVRAARNRVGDISKVLSAGLPPEIESIVSSQTGMDEYELELRVKGMGSDRGDMVCRIDGRLSDCGVFIKGRDYDIAGTGGTGADTNLRSVRVGSGRVSTGDHEYQFAFKNAAGTVEGPTKTIQLKGRSVGLGLNLNNLYVVAAGISHYSNPALNEGVMFAAADADLLADRFRQQQGKGLYQKVTAVSLPNSNATVKSIQHAVAQAAAKIEFGNTFVLYLAGHGIAVNGEYYFIPWAEKYMTEKDLLSNGLSREAIQNLLKQVSTKTNRIVLILDTCGSGAVLGGGNVENEQAAMQRLGGISGYTVFAASNKVAMEGYQNHGVFTYVLVEGMKAADSDTQGVILITRLGEYAMVRVPQITKQKWGYEQTPIIMYGSGQFPIVSKATN